MRNHEQDPAQRDSEADASSGESALELADRFGFHIFPVSPPRDGKGGKGPLVRDWEQVARTDGRLFAAHPRANLGVALGRSGHLVLDVDDPGGEEAARKLLGGEIPKTLTVSTGRDGGGRHYYFRQPEGMTVRSQNSVAPGLDLKAGGGYVVAPPSLHASGRRYAFEDPDVPIATLAEEHVRALVGISRGTGVALSPKELERLRAPGEREERIQYVRDVLAAIPNDSTFDARDAWVGMAHSIKVACDEGYEAEALQLFDEWSERWKGNGKRAYDPDETNHVFETLSPSRSGGFPALLRMAKERDHKPSARLLTALHAKRIQEAKAEFEKEELADRSVAAPAKQAPCFEESGTSPPGWLLRALDGTRGLLAELQAALPSLTPEEREIAEAALVQELQGKIGRQAAATTVRRALHPDDRDPFTPNGVLRPLDLSTADLNVPYLVRGLIPAASVGILVAPHSMGKSFLAIDLALSVAFRVPWMGAQPTESGPALFIVAEGQAAFPLRLAGWLAAQERLPERFTRRDLSEVLSRRAMIAQYPLRLDDPRLVQGLINTIEASGVRIVVMDTLGRLLGSEQSDDHNDTANSVMHDLHEVAAETGATILLIHHTGHENTDRSRGASAWEQAVDFVFVVKGSAKGFSDGLPVDLVNKKLKEGDPAYPLAFAKREVSLTVEGDSRSSAVVELARAPKPTPVVVRVFQAVLEDPGLGIVQLRKVVGIKKDKVDASRDELLDQGAIENRGTKSRHKYHVAPGWSVAFDETCLVPPAGDDGAPPADASGVDLSDRTAEEAPNA